MGRLSIRSGSISVRRGGEPAASVGARVARLHDPAAQGVELGQLRVHALEHRVEPPPFGLAGCAARVVGGERVDDLVEREPDRLELARELDALDGLGRVVAVAGWTRAASGSTPRRS